jgi:hypothetical protein
MLVVVILILITSSQRLYIWVEFGKCILADNLEA